MEARWVWRWRRGGLGGGGIEGKQKGILYSSEVDFHDCTLPALRHNGGGGGECVSARECVNVRTPTQQGLFSWGWVPTLPSPFMPVDR